MRNIASTGVTKMEGAAGTQLQSAMANDDGGGNIGQCDNVSAPALIAEGAGATNKPRLAATLVARLLPVLRKWCNKIAYIIDPEL